MKAPTPAAGSNRALLAVTDLAVHFGAVRAVDGVSLSVPPGTIVGLVGPNGAGKSTVINAIAGMTAQSRGKVVFAGREIQDEKAYVRARRGLARTFQNLELFQTMSVLENTIVHTEAAAVQQDRFYMFRRQSLEDVRERGMKVLRSLGIAHLAGRRVDQLSYADRKIVEFARAIATDVKLVLLDEPAAGVSSADLADLTRRIREHLAGNGIAALLVEHNMQLVRAVCQSIYVMDAGNIIATGNFDEVMSNENVKRAYLG